MRRLTVAAVLLAVLAFAAAGCGGDDESSADTDTVVATDTVTEDTTTEDTTTEDTTTDVTDTDASGALPSGECLELVNAAAALGQAFAAGASTDLDESSEQFAEFAEQVPEEIRDDVRILADAYAEYADAIGDIGIEAGQTPTAEQITEFQQALATIDQASVTAASARIEAWADANCPSG